MITDFADPHSDICYDCHQEHIVYEYLLVEGNKLMPLCQECAVKRQRAAQQRMGEAESE